MKKAWKKRLAVVSLPVAGVFVALFGAELLVRALAPQQLTVWVQSPNGVALLQPERTIRLARFEHPIETNELGHRDIPHVGEPPMSRVLVLGDSFAEGLHVPLASTFSRTLARLLSSEEMVSVVNAGVSGWGTDDQLRYFEAEGRALGPDLVICLFTLYNDVTDNMEREFHVASPEGLVVRPGSEPEGWPYGFHKFKAFLGGRSHLFQLTRSAMSSRNVMGEFDAIQDHWADLVLVDSPVELQESWTHTFNLLDALADSTRAAGAEMVLVPIPMEFQFDAAAQERFFSGSGLSPEDVDLWKPQATLEAWGQRKGVPVLDLHDRFQAESKNGTKMYIPVDRHWNAEGHRAAAEATAEWLENAPPLPSPSSGR